MKNHMIVHIPHASVVIPQRYRSAFCAADLQREIQVMTDWYCDELFGCKAEKIIFPVSRLVCDVERFRDDKEEIMAQLGMGAVYENCSDLTPLKHIRDREQLLRRYYDPHHRSLTLAVDNRMEQYGRCLIIDAHSFYPTPLPYELSKDPDRPDFCIGTSNYHTPPAITEMLCDFFIKEGHTVKINAPFSGTLVPMKYFEIDRRVASVMIEVNRRLYMDAPGIKNAEFCRIRKLIRDCLEMISAV